LVTCHSKHVVVVNTHELSAFEYGAKMEVCYLSRTGDGVKSKRGIGFQPIPNWQGCQCHDIHKFDNRICNP